MKYGERKPGSPFDNRIQAALRVGDYKIITGMVFGDGWYKPVYSEGTVEFHLLLFFTNNPHALENLLPFLNWLVYLANSGTSVIHNYYCVCVQEIWTASSAVHHAMLFCGDLQLLIGW